MTLVFTHEHFFRVKQQALGMDAAGSCTHCSDQLRSVAWLLTFWRLPHQSAKPPHRITDRTLLEVTDGIGITTFPFRLIRVSLCLPDFALVSIRKATINTSVRLPFWGGRGRRWMDVQTQLRRKKAINLIPFSVWYLLEE